jgi:TonB family protein
MKRHDQKPVSARLAKATPLNLLDLSEPRQRRSGGLYWTMLVSMIAAYGAYMATIANMQRPAEAFADNAHDTHASLPAESDVEALEKADREPIEIAIPGPPETVATESPEPPLPKLIDRLPQRDDDRDPPAVEPQDVAEAEAETPAPAESPVVIPAMTSNKISLAARAILRRINAAANNPEDQTAFAIADDPAPVEIATSAEPPPPLPVRRPYIASEIASHQLSSQSGSRLARLERPPRVPANVLSYRASVRAHLAAHRPSGGFGSGRVSVSFRLSDDGKISSAQIIQAPRAEDLDKRALSALYKAAPFPAAPEGAAGKHRAFTVSFIFE